MAEGDTLLNAAIGGVVSIVFAFLPVSPMLGGGVAAYLHGGDREAGAKVGALSGVFAAIPLSLVFGAIGVVFLGAGLANRVAFTAIVLVVVFFLLVVVSVIYSAVLGAVGGYLVVYLVEEDVV